MEPLSTIGGSVVSEITGFIVEPVKRQISYLCFYNRNIKNLQDCNKKLQDKKDEAQHFMNDADRKFKKAAPRVSHWHNDAEKLNQEACEFLEQEIGESSKPLNWSCQSLWSRYSLSRKAFKMNGDINKKLAEAPSFGELVYDNPSKNIGSNFNLEGIRDFDSRESVMNEILEALKDDKLHMIGICGMGGVGKTTMAKKIVRIVEKERLFDAVAMTTVSQKPDFSKIQIDIVSELGLKFDRDDSQRDRAKKLRGKLTECNRNILFIFDDVWEELKAEQFEEIGIPSPNEIRRCKILLTSRKEDACNKMGSHKNFTIRVLSDEEAWNLFREMALTSNFIGNHSLHQTAKEISDECGGLPIAIVTIAKALKNKGKSIWDDALLQLRKCDLKGISGMEKDVYSRIELSYNLLEHEEAKSCFLLCCLFPEDFNIRVAFLVRYGMGLRLFQNVDNFLEASNRVCALINELKESFLLPDVDADEDGDGYEFVKMHDVERDVAISIASKDKHKYVVLHDAAMKNWPETDCTAVSLVCKDMKERPIDLEYPKLQLLWLEYKNSSKDLPDNFFEGMEELKVVFLKISGSLPKSLRLLKNLRTLCVGDFGSDGISMIGDLTNLEVLEIWNSYIDLPEEIARMGNLRVLDLRRMGYLEYTPVGVISQLTKLEELQAFLNWESKVDGEKTNVSLSELKSLPITTLRTCVPKVSILPKALNFGELSRFNIVACEDVAGKNNKLRYLEGMDLCVADVSRNSLYLMGCDASDIRGSAISVLLGKTENLVLLEIQNLKNILYELEEENCSGLKSLWIENCTGLEYIVEARLKQIPHMGFAQLEKLKLCGLSNLKAFWSLPFSKTDEVGRN